MSEKEAYWQGEAPKYHWAHARLRLIAHQIRSDSSVHSVLDIGAGAGTLAYLLGREYTYLGLDITGRKEADDSWPVIRFCDLDQPETLPALLPQRYQAVVLSGVLEYVRDWRALLQQAIMSALQPDGLLLVSVIYDAFYRIFPRRPHPAWRWRFEPSMLQLALETSHVHVERIYPLWTGGHPWTILLSRLFVQRAGILPGWLPWLGVNQFLFVGRKGQP